MSAATRPLRATTIALSPTMHRGLLRGASVRAASVGHVGCVMDEA